MESASPGAGARPLRVMHVIDSLAEGGAEQNLLTLIRNLPAHEYEHHLAWLYPDERLLPAFAPHVASVLALRTGRQLGLLGASSRLAKHIRRTHPDVVSAKLIRAQLVARIAVAISGRIPLVSTWECVSYGDEMYVELGHRGPWLRRLTWLLDAGTGVRDAHFVAVSHEVADHNARVLRVASSRVSVIYNAIDPSKIVDIGSVERDALRKDLGVRDGAPLLLSVGRLVAQKDHATSVRAMVDVANAFPDALLVIAGAGQLRTPLEETVDMLQMRDHVRILGARTDVPRLLRAADLFVFASRYEGLGIALMEALAAGLPAVCSDIGTSREVAAESEAVRFFPRGDASALASTLVHALHDLPSLRLAARAGSPGVLRRFGPDVMAAGYGSLFRNVASAT